MPEQPENGTLLYRLAGPDDGTGANDAKEWWYDPATRQVVLVFERGSFDFSDFSLSKTVLVDQWCLEAGAPPYTARQVHHNGSHGITTTDVNNVQACMRTCTLTLTISTSAVHNGRADLVATAASAQGEVVFSLDGFASAALPPDRDSLLRHTFERLRPGTYTVSVRETRPDGCRATATLRITTSYGVRYRHSFRDKHNAACLLEIFEREYTGQAQELAHAQPAPVVLDWPGSGTDHVFTNLLRGSECQLSLFMTTAQQLRPLFSGDERLHLVVYSRQQQEQWRGFLLPEQYDVAFLSPPNKFNLRATDGLGTLSALPFVGSAGEALRGDWTLLAIILFCLGKLNLDLPLHVLFQLFPSPATTLSPALTQARLDVSQFQDEKGKAWDCGKVLRELLTTFQGRLYQERGAWWLERLIDLRTEALTYEVYTPDGERQADAQRTLLHTIERSTRSRLYWQNAVQRQSLRPAVSAVTVASEPGEPVNQLAGFLPRNSDLPRALPLSWTSNTTTPDVPFSELVYQGKDKPPTLRLLGSRTISGGYPTDQALNDALAASPWVQLPLTAPLPLPAGRGGQPHVDETVVLTFTLTPYGNTPAAEGVGAHRRNSYMGVAVRYGDRWLIQGQPGGAGSATPFIGGIELADTKAMKILLRGYSTDQLTNQSFTVRLYAPVGGPTRATVDITDLQLTYTVTDEQQADSYTDTYTAETGQLISRVDDSLSLVFADTPRARRLGSLLEGTGMPSYAWYEPAQAGVLREAGDYLVRDRVRWQLAPAQGLYGVLRGPFTGAGALLTDPAEKQPGVYLLPACRHDAAAATWEITAVQLLNLTPPAVVLRDAIANENSSFWLTESGQSQVYETYA